MAYISGIEIIIDVDFHEVDYVKTEEYINSIVKKHSELLFNQTLVIQTHLHEGSLKITAVIIGSLYIAIGQYGSFRSGVDYLIKDAKILKDITVSHLVRAGVNDADIISSSNINCIPNKIRRVLLAIDRLESKRNLSDSEFKKELSKIKTSIKNICNNLSIKDKQLFAYSISQKYLPEDTEIPQLAQEYKVQIREEELNFNPLLVFDKNTS
jgi:hypothetical protein